MASSDICLKSPVGYSPGGKEGLRKLVDIQGSPTPSSETVYLNEQEIKQKCQEAYIDEQGALSKLRYKKEE